MEWKFKPMSDTIKLWLITASVGCIGVMTSIIGVYVILGLDKFWISMYVVVLLFVMAFCALFQATFIKVRPYRPWWMLGFGAVAGFNKGIGGGGYGPVVTVGGLIAGIPPKSMLGITALNEGTVSGFATIVWAATLTLGVKIDYILLPTMMLASIGSAVAAPYMVRVFPTKFWTWIIPAYCAVVAAIVLYRLWPEIMKKMAGG